MTEETHTDNPDLNTITKVDGHLQAVGMNIINEGVTVRFALSRFLYFTALQYVANFGSDEAARIFREAAQNIEDGVLKHREGDRPKIN